MLQLLALLLQALTVLFQSCELEPQTLLHRIRRATWPGGVNPMLTLGSRTPDAADSHPRTPSAPHSTSASSKRSSPRRRAVAVRVWHLVGSWTRAYLAKGPYSRLRPSRWDDGASLGHRHFVGDSGSGLGIGVTICVRLRRLGRHRRLHLGTERSG